MYESTYEVMGTLEIITVNYNTPDLVERLVKSIREYEGNYFVHVVDGSDDEHPLPYIDDNVMVHHIGWNIHHGRGLDYALNNVQCDWCLLIDSDNYIKKPIIQRLIGVTNEKEIVGHYCHVNEKGESIMREYSDAFPIKYWHPSFMLINVAYYKLLNRFGVKFIHHGAPAIKIAKYLNKEGISDIVGIDIGDDINDYVFMEGEGTVKRWGYNL